MVDNHLSDGASKNLELVKLHKQDSMRNTGSIVSAVANACKVLHDKKLRRLYRLSVELDAPISREVKKLDVRGQAKMNFRFGRTEMMPFVHLGLPYLPKMIDFLLKNGTRKLPRRVFLTTPTSWTLSSSCP
jgi:hypothetical protein